MIEIDDLTLRFGSRTVLRLAHWQAPSGAAALIVGPSGSGKSSLLNIIAGLLRPSSGQVRVDGHDLGAMREAERDAFRATRIGIVFQTARLVRVLTVRDNLALAQRLARRPFDATAISTTLDRLGLSGKERAWPRALSVGEAQRAAIARAVVAQPALILADEPTSALDDVNAESAMATLRQAADSCGAMLLVASHDARIASQFDRRLDLSVAAT